VSAGIDIGHGHVLRVFAWDPDRYLNPQFDGIPSEPRAGATIDHPHAKTGEPCSGAINFDTPTMRRLVADRALWQVHSWEPLTISPSVLCSCGDHGFIRDGRWVPA
jgi:hypothetical protein